MKSICILGVDGTGKSSLVKKIVETIGHDKAVVQYMGSKQWETKMAIYYHKPGKKTMIRSLLCSLSVIFDMYYRVYKHVFKNKVIVFDRYVDELFINLEMEEGRARSRMKKKMYSFFFGKFFYRPSVTFYLTCPADISISRKDDIVTREDAAKLIDRKNIYDHFYKRKPSVITIDTGKNDLKQTLCTVMSAIDKIK